MNCGKSVPEKAKFCPFCGENNQLDATEKKPTGEHKLPKNIDPEVLSQLSVTQYYTLLEPESEFHGYRIIRLMNKDTEGIKYIAERDKKQYVLKVFFKSSMHNMDSLFGLQMRLKKLNHLKDKHTAKVVEVNPHSDPAYMVAEYIHGVSLAHIKQHNPEKLTEDFVRHIAPQLIRTAIVIRKHGLTLSMLTLSGIMIDDKDDAIILSSGITFEDRDEREDVFLLGAILAQTLSHNAMFRTIYSIERLKLQKFTYIGGVSLSLNKILGECLHRNILQRYLTLQDFLIAMESLIPVQSDEIWSVQESTTFAQMEAANSVEKPKTHIEFGFWLIIILLIAMIAVLFTTNVFSVLFGGKGDTLQYVGILNRQDSRDSVNTVTTTVINPTDTPVQTTYGNLKSGTGMKPDFRRNIPEMESGKTNVAAAAPKSKRPINMIYIEPSTIGFGRLKENLHHNVSISSFYISPREITQAEWNRLMKPANCTSFGENLPVDNVSWFDVAIYCNGRSEVEGLTPAYKIRGVGASTVVTCDFKANGYRLPTEAEWELAAKSGQLFNYSGSDDPSDFAWYRDNSGGKIHSPSSKSPNGFGLYDMTGNVSEWCWDWYDANYIRSLPTFINPSGPETGTLKTIRGGSVNNGEGRNLNILWREKGDPNRGYQYVGFRLVRSN